MRLVFVTQTLDAAHGSLAQTLDLVEALAARVDELCVLTREDRWGLPPPNVEVRRFEARGKITRGIAFERELARSLPRADGVLVHMVPTFAVLAAPQTRLRKVPLLLWYTHWHASLTLRLATRLSDTVLSVDRASFPLASDGVRGIGHAIDVERFDSPPPESHVGPLRLLALGRTARWKGLATLVDAFRAADVDATLELRGPSLTRDEEQHRRELAAAAAPDPRISIEPPVPRADVPALLRAADVVVSPVEPRAGATLDKAVYEAAACSRPVVTTNAALAPFLGDLPLPLLTPPRDATALARALEKVVQATPEQRAQVGTELRSRVVRDHSLAHWADGVISTVTEIRSSGGG
jgi:glycosyltransferase involved in cell wall biosynthesis